MYYYGYFRDTDCKTDKLGNLYKVIIITNFTKKEYEVGGELQLSSSPFTISWSGADDNLFKSYKCSTATVGLYQENYRFEFNNTQGNNVYVALLKLKKNKRKEDDLGITTDGDVYDILWTGYATPNAYSQDYNRAFDYFELECQDSLSTLKYKRYTGDNYGHTYSRFSDIFIKYVGGLGNYKHIYTASSIVLPTKDLSGILDYLYIDESNFYDEDGKGMAVLDVLGEICTYLGLTMIPWGDSLYILDYHSLELGEYYDIYSVGHGDYSFLSSTTWEYGDSLFMRHHLDITADDFIGGDTNLSLGSTYNKVTVTADLYGMDTIIHDRDDADNFKYSERLDEAGKSYGRNQILGSTAKGTVILTGWQDSEKEDHLQKTIYRFKDLDNDKASQGNFLQYFQTRWYNLDTSYPHDGTLIGIWGTVMNPSHNTNYDDLYTKVGASYVEYLSEEIEVDSGIDPNDLKITGDKTTAIVMSLHNSKLYDSSRMDFDRQQSGYHYGYWYIDEKGDGKDIVWEDFMKNQILFSVITKRIIIGEGDYIFIKGKWKFYANNESFCPVNYWEKEEKPHSINSFVWCQLNDGNGLYWDGEVWKPASEFKGPTGVTLNPKFRMPYNVSGKTSRYDEEFPITSYADFDLNLEEEGYIIPAPPCKPGMSRPVTLNFHIYRPWGPTWTSDNVADLAILEDFDMTVTGKKEETIDSEDNSNTSYTNILEETAIEEYPDLELKITSWDNKQINRSSTYWFELSPKSMTGSRDPVTYVASNFTRTQEIANKSTGQLGRPEELLVGNIAKQYSTPTASLGVTLFNSLGITPYSTLSYHFMGPRTFVVDGMTIDYSYDTVNLKLIERK